MTPHRNYSVDLYIFIIPCTKQKVKILTVMYNLSWIMIVLVLGIRLRMFLGLPDPDPLVRGADPAPDSTLFSEMC
jgi:hypothetical protein